MRRLCLPEGKDVLGWQHRLTHGYPGYVDGKVPLYVMQNAPRKWKECLIALLVLSDWDTGLGPSARAEPPPLQTDYEPTYCAPIPGSLFRDRCRSTARFYEDRLHEY